MANEITQKLQLRAAKTGAVVNFEFSDFFNMSGSDMTQVTQTAGSAQSVQIDFGSIVGNPRKILIKNNMYPPTTNTDLDLLISANQNMSGLNLVVRHGDCILFECESSVLYATARGSGASVNFQVTAIDQ